MSDSTHSESVDEFPVVQKLHELRKRLQPEPGGISGLRERFDSARYELGEPIHEGRRSALFLAHDQELDRTVVIKFYAIDDDLNRKQIVQEGKRLASIQSPFVCTCYDLGWSGNQPFLVLEAISGCSMAEQRNGDPTRDWLSLTDFMIDVCRGVEAMHAVDLFHWDLKPSNILIGPDKSPKIVDLGLALFRSDVESNNRHLQGSPSYLPPEVARGEGCVDGVLIDIFGIGAVLYEALTGQPPFERDNKIESLAASFVAQIVAPRQIAPGLPPRLESICLRCLAENPADRFESATAVRKELEAFRKSAQRKLKRLLLTVFGIVALGTIIASIMLTRRDPGSTEKKLLESRIPAQYDSSKVSAARLFAALQSKTTSQLELRNDFDLQLTFFQKGKAVAPDLLRPNIDLEIRLEASRPCFVSVHRFEFNPDGQISRSLSEYPAPPHWCQLLEPGQPLSFVSTETDVTRGPSCYYVIAAESEWTSRGEYPDGRLQFEPNHRGVATKQLVSERIVTFSIVSPNQ